MKEILKVLIGSQAHGLATPKSDYDYRGVFVNPTSEILSLNGSTKNVNWIEDKIDDTSWEIGHFLFLATKCNPTILEVFLAPLALDFYPEIETFHGKSWQIPEEGKELRELFPYIWNSTGVYNAFRGYSLNQRKKFLDEKDGRPRKFAMAYLRTLYQGWELLTTGTFTIRIADTPIGPFLKVIKEGDASVGEVMQTCWDWEKKLEQAYKENPDKEADIERVNNFLLEVRKNNW